MKFVMFNVSIHFVAHVSYSLSENKKHFITCRLSQCLLQITRFFSLLSNRLWVILPETIVQWCYLYKTKTKSLIKHDMLVYSYSLLLRETSLLPQWYALTGFFFLPKQYIRKKVNWYNYNGKSEFHLSFTTVNCFPHYLVSF